MNKIVDVFEKHMFDTHDQMFRRKIVFFLLFLNVSTSAAVSIYIPCIKQMSVDLNTTNALMQMTIVAHLIGEFFGRILCGPLIDSYSSRSVILPALALSVFGHCGCFISTSLPIFITMRFIQAIGSSVVYVVSLGIINESFKDNKEKGSVVGVLELYQPIAWILSPFVGCILSEIGSWRLSFFVLMLTQVFGILFFIAYFKKRAVKSKKRFSVSKFFCDYKAILKNFYFIIYALIPGLFSGGYMIFASNSPFICSRFFGNSTADVALFQAIPLIFYVLATFVYRFIVQNFDIRMSKKIGIIIYIIFGIYMVVLLSFGHAAWNANNLLTLMCIQCIGSAFLVPVSILKAVQSSSDASCVGASTVVVFRNIIMSLCITISAKLSESITMIMGSVFMTVGTALVLIMTRRIMKTRAIKKLNIKM